MVDGLANSDVQSEFNPNPISTNSFPNFLENFQDHEISNSTDPIVSYTNRSTTRETIIPTKARLCDDVLKYINRVLMEDDDFEDESLTFEDSTLNATKRSFQEIIVGEKPQNEETNDDLVETRNNKFLAHCPDEYIVREDFAKLVLLFGKNDESNLNAHYGMLSPKAVSKKEAANMRNLLFQCMDFVAISDNDRASELLVEIRLRACAYGDGTQRLTHYLANGLEARLTGGRVPQHKTLAFKVLSDTDLLKAFRLYLTDLPFIDTSYFFANEMIIKLAEKASSIHVIDFGIMHGLQWPPLIQRLSKRYGGPPKLRITGIDFPQQGFRPDARLKDTGRQLSSYCEEFNVPFEYNCFAKKWETIKLEELEIKEDEVLVANCMFHFMYLLDDTIMEHSPRDDVLGLIKSINPRIFIHVTVNGTYNSPFFVSRFREALFHFCSWFDMFDVVLPRESPDRMKIEREVLGREMLNILASEGLQRIERPETYKQWQKRTIRAGFEQLPLDPNIVNEIHTRLKLYYHKDFFVNEVGHWLLNGWKGRALFAQSCWKPA